jgi:hypothetical protein
MTVNLGILDWIYQTSGLKLSIGDMCIEFSGGVVKFHCKIWGGTNMAISKAHKFTK